MSRCASAPPNTATESQWNRGTDMKWLFSVSLCLCGCVS